MTRPACSPLSCWSLLTSSRPGRVLQFLQHARRPDEEILNVVALERVLILGVGATAADAQVLHRLQIKIHSGKLRQLAAQPADDPIGTDASLVQRLKSDEHIPGIQRSAKTAAVERHHRIDCGIAFQRCSPRPSCGQRMDWNDVS